MECVRRVINSPAEDLAISIVEASKEPVKTIPWRSILIKPPVLAHIISHFCHNLTTFILLTWMLIYYHQGVRLGLSNTAGVLAAAIGTSATGYVLQHVLIIFYSYACLRITGALDEDLNFENVCIQLSQFPHFPGQVPRRMFEVSVAIYVA